jgi:hypothetical protein
MRRVTRGWSHYSLLPGEKVAEGGGRMRGLPHTCERRGVPKVASTRHRVFRDGRRCGSGPGRPANLPRREQRKGVYNSCGFRGQKGNFALNAHGSRFRCARRELRGNSEARVMRWPRAPNGRERGQEARLPARNRNHRLSEHRRHPRLDQPECMGATPS